MYVFNKLLQAHTSTCFFAPTDAALRYVLMLLCEWSNTREKFRCLFLAVEKYYVPVQCSRFANENTWRAARGWWHLLARAPPRFNEENRASRASFSGFFIKKAWGHFGHCFLLWRWWWWFQGCSANPGAWHSTCVWHQVQGTASSYLMSSWTMRCRWTMRYGLEKIQKKLTIHLYVKLILQSVRGTRRCVLYFCHLIRYVHSRNLAHPNPRS